MANKENKILRVPKKTTKLAGEIGELMVAMKLLELGHSPARPFVDYGSDILLENGKTLQIKGALPTGGSGCYRFKLNRSRIRAMFLICICVDSGITYIIPASEVGIKYTLAMGRKSTKYKKYKERWDFLD
jgi:hypothetical protein